MKGNLIGLLFTLVGSSACQLKGNQCSVDADADSDGINDCEAAIVSLDMQTLDSLLESVDEGNEVVDYMRPLIIKPS